MQRWVKTNQSCVALLDELAVWRVEDVVVHILKRERRLGIHVFTRRIPVSLPKPLGGLLTVTRVGCVKSTDVGCYRKGTVDFWIFRVKFWLVEVVSVAHVRAMNGCGIEMRRLALESPAVELFLS